MRTFPAFFWATACGLLLALCAAPAASAGELPAEYQQVLKYLARYTHRVALLSTAQIAQPYAGRTALLSRPGRF